MTSLSRAVQDLNHSVDIVLPKYDCLNVNHVRFIAASVFEDIVSLIIIGFYCHSN